MTTSPIRQEKRPCAVTGLLQMMVVVMLGLCAVPGRALTLVDGGAARCVIVLLAGEQPLLRPAAVDLQACLRKMSGAEVRIVAGAAPAGVAAPRASGVVHGPAGRCDR